MGRIRNLEFAPIVAISPVVAPDDGAERPVIAVLEAAPSLSPSIAEVCGVLGVRVELVGDMGGIVERLRVLRPIGVLVLAGEIDCPVYDMLMAVAAFEPDLPVLLVTDDRASVRGAVRSVERLWQLGGMIHLTRRLDTTDVVDFLSRAGRRSGTVHLMPA